MNFLLHRHFAQLESGDPATAFGAMLPDLVRMVDRRWRPRPEQARVADAAPGVARILGGIDHHLAIDLWFHRRSELHDGEGQTVEAFRAAGAVAPRLALCAHPAWEMLLDGAWVRRRGATEVEASLASDALAYAVDASVALRLHDPDPGRDLAPTGESLARLWRGVPRLASGYATAEGMAARLDGMRAGVGLPRASDEELARWHVALRSLEPAADAALIALERARSDGWPPTA